MGGRRARLDHPLRGVRDCVGVGWGAWAYRFGRQQVVGMPPGGPAPGSLPLPPAPGAAHFCLVWPGPIEEAIAHLERHGIPLAERPAEHVGARGRVELR